MPTIAVLGNVKIQMFARDHAPPHFHLVTPDSEALVAIGTLEILAGKVRRRDAAAALEWAARNRRLLTDEWNRLSG